MRLQKNDNSQNSSQASPITLAWIFADPAQLIRNQCLRLSMPQIVLTLYPKHLFLIIFLIAVNNLFF